MHIVYGYYIWKTTYFLMTCGISPIETLKNSKKNQLTVNNDFIEMLGYKATNNFNISLYYILKCNP